MPIGSTCGTGKKIISKIVGKGTISTEDKEIVCKKQRKVFLGKAKLYEFVFLLFRTGTCRNYNHKVIKPLVLLFFSNYKT